ncbi:MAG: DUF1893 domain-containing protein [Spirochaetales bacterium]|nr:DUF1893 domain-containing protein [Spirochaetales bacterium]
MTANELPEGVTCRVFEGDELIFESGSHWLHPLFELGAYLKEHPEHKRKDLSLQDRIIGRAAALMIARLGIKHCSTPVVSERALPIFEGEKIELNYESTTPCLPCKTEEILAQETNPAQAWALLEERARKAAEARR